MSIRNLQYFKDDFWNRQREEFLSKEDGINGILLGQDWNLVGNTTANNPISLPSLDTFDEIYVEMFHSEGTIMHQEEFKKESLLFESTNTTHREILLDSIGDTNTYMTYDIENNTITATSIEGNVIDENSTNVFLGVYVKKTGTAEGELGANRVSYDDSVSELGASDVQGAIEKLDEKIDNIPSGGTGKSAYDYAKDNGYTGTEEEFAALMNTNFSTTYLTQKNPSGSGTFTFDGDAQFTGDITATDEDGNEISLVDIFESTNNLPSAGTKLIETLPANETTVTFTSDEITENTTLNAVYTSIFGVKLESANVENGVLTLTFEAQEEDMTVVALINATMSDSDETHLGDIDADEVKVDDTNLGLGVTNVQGALEKIVENVGGNVDGEIEKIKDTLGYTVSKNLLENTASSTTLNGITYTVNNDGSVTVNGTATSNIQIIISGKLYLPNGDYILSGCPEGGSEASYFLEVYSTTLGVFLYDVGQGINFSINRNESYYVRIRVKSGCTVENLTFYPMIRKADITDDTYEPFSGLDVDVRLNNILEWKLVGSVTSRTELTLPSNFKELYVKVESTYSSYTPTHPSYGICQGVIAKNILSSTKQYINLSHADGVCEVYASLSTLSLNRWYIGSTDMFTTSGSAYVKTTVYYR